jgi:pSer/pThr/pTyr-binding forkhead associated (FHA) protein
MGAEPRTPRPASARELKAVLEAERAGHPFLLYRDGDGGQRLVALDDQSRSLTLGRGAQTDVTLDWDQEVSAVHAELHCTGGEWTLADDGLSSNGTYLNGARLGGRQRLRDGDHLRLGRTVLLFRASTVEPIAGTVTAGDAPTVERLSNTQRRVLIALCRPYRDGGSFVTPATNRQIADEVFLSVDAVKTHLRILFGKFALDQLPQNQKRVRLAECALQWGLVSQRDLEGGCHQRGSL